jgi:mannosyl-oligosaccharide alpha-1,2-mannosidase
MYLLINSAAYLSTHTRFEDIKSANGIINNLIYITPKRGLLYVGDLSDGQLHHRLEHLSCYLPGVLAMGASLLGNHLTTEEKELHKWAAHGLAYTCAISYADQISGLGPDEIRISTRGTKWIDEVAKWKANNRQGPAPGTSDPPREKDPVNRDYWNGYPNAYLLRPEVISMSVAQGSLSL